MYFSTPPPGAIKNARLCGLLYPGWECLFLVDEPSVSNGTVAAIRQHGGLVAPFPALPVAMDRNGTVQRTRLGHTLSRLLVALDSTVDRVLVRDVDGRLSGRERLAVEEWQRSGRSLHVLRDHPGHCHRPLLAGLIGLRLTPALRAHLLRSLQSWSGQYPADRRFEATERYGNDNDFLLAHVWPQLDYLAHDSYCCEEFPDTDTNEGTDTGTGTVTDTDAQGRNSSRARSVHPFPSERIDFEHCGQIFSYGGEGREDPVLAAHVEQMEGWVAPMRCRGRPDWEYG